MKKVQPYEMDGQTNSCDRQEKEAHTQETLGLELLHIRPYLTAAVFLSGLAAESLDANVIKEENFFWRRRVLWEAKRK